LEADRKAREEEGRITIVPADITKDKLEQQVERFKHNFAQMSKDQQDKLIADLMKPV